MPVELKVGETPWKTVLEIIPDTQEQALILTALGGPWYGLTLTKVQVPPNEPGFVDIRIKVDKTDTPHPSDMWLKT